jgi:hypothetical protein
MANASSLLATQREAGISRKTDTEAPLSITRSPDDPFDIEVLPPGSRERSFRFLRWLAAALASVGGRRASATLGYASRSLARAAGSGSPWPAYALI